LNAKIKNFKELNFIFEHILNFKYFKYRKNKSDEEITWLTGRDVLPYAPTCLQ
jgi:hypothetical protein